MLKEVAGDVLRTKAEMVAHGVAPNDSYANGLALALRDWTRDQGQSEAKCLSLTSGSALHQTRLVILGIRFATLGVEVEWKVSGLRIG